VGVTYGYPISEYQGIRLGLNLQRAELLTSTLGSAQQAVDWVRNNGKTFQRTGDYLGQPIQFYGTRFDSYELVTGWYWDSRNRALFATRGTQHSLNLTYTVPGSDVEYWKAEYEYHQYFPLWRKFVFALGAELGYSRELGDTTAAPPYSNFFGGGPNSVRGFQESRLGPKDNFGNPYGGNLKVIGRGELIFPLPQKWQTSARAGLFYDIGNVFNQGGGTKFTDNAGFPIDTSFDIKQLRAAVGIGVQWLAPLGLFQFSYAIPVKYRSATELDRGDQLEGFQFSIGQAF
jgi:outer membrane protein insertion porin family